MKIKLSDTVIAELGKVTFRPSCTPYSKDDDAKKLHEFLLSNISGATYDRLFELMKEYERRGDC